MTAQAATLPAPHDTAPQKPARRRAGWRRWLLRIAIALVVLRLLLALSLSWLIGLGAGLAGYDVVVDSSSLSLFGGYLRLEHVELRPEGGFDEEAADQPLSRIAFDVLEVDLATRALLGGTLRVESVDLVNLQVDLVKTPAGWPLLGPPATAADEEPEPEPEVAQAEPAALDLRPPLELGRLDVHPLHLTLTDLTGERPDVLEFNGAVHASGLQGDGQRGELHVQLTSPEALDVLRVDGTIEAQLDHMRALVGVDLVGLAPHALESVLLDVGLRPISGRLDGKLAVSAELWSEPEDRTRLGAELRTRAKFLADGEEVLGLDDLVARMTQPGSNRAVSLELRGLRGAAAMRRDGALRVGGLELLPGPAVAVAPPAAEPEAPATGGPGLEIELVSIADARFEWRDERRGPAALLAVELPTLQIGPRAADVAPDEPMPLALHARVPGFCEDFGIEGLIALSTTAPAAELTLSATGFRGGALDPWLASAGFESEMRDGVLSAWLGAQAKIDPDGGVEATLRLRDLQLTDGEVLLALASVTCDGIAVEPATGALSAQHVEIDGPIAGVHRDAEGVLHVAGLRSVPVVPLIAPPPVALAGAPAPDPLATPAADAPPDPPAAAGPAVHVVNALWHGAHFTLRDDAVDPPVDLELKPMLQAKEIRIGEGTPGGQLDLRLEAPGVWERCDMAMVVQPPPPPATVGVKAVVTLGDMHGKGFAGWWRAAGLEPPEMHSDLSATLDLVTGGGSTELRLTDITWTDGGVPVVSVPLVHVAGAGSGPGGARIESIELPDAKLVVGRAADGALKIGNMRFAPLPARSASKSAARPAAAAPAPAPQPAAASPASPTAVAGPASPPAVPTASTLAPPEPTAEDVNATESTEPASAFELGALRLGAGSIVVNWHDEAVSPPLDLELHIASTVEALRTQAGADPARTALTLGIPGVAGKLQWDGTLSLAGGELAVDGALVGEGISAGPLAVYLPPGCTSTLRDGRLALKVRVGAGAAAEGGSRSMLTVSDLSWRDGEEPVLLGMERLTVDVTRLDPVAGVAVIGEVALVGLELRAARRADGALSALGFDLGAPPPDAPAEPETEPETEPVPELEPVPPAVAAGSKPAARAPRRPPSLLSKLRDVRVERIELELRSLRLENPSGEGSAPFAVALKLASPEPLVVLDRSRDDLPPCRLELRGSAEPIVRALEADLSVDVAGARPEMRVDLRLTGLRGAGLTEVFPELAERIDGSELQDGSFTATFLAGLSWPRHGPLDLDFGGGLSGDLELTDVALHAVPDGEAVLGLESLAIGLADVRPGRMTHLSQVELTGLVARIGVTPEGIRTAGLLLKSPPAPETAAPPDAPPPPPSPEPAGPPGPPLLIDRIVASGLDLVVRDDTCTPPMELPLVDLDVEVRNFSKDHTPPRPMRFTASVHAGEIMLPERKSSSSLLAGMAGAAARAVGGAKDEDVLEPRRIFEELAVQGRIVPETPPTGWVNVNLTALELQGFAGPAAQGGVLIGDGTVDAAVRMRLQGVEGGALDMTLTFGNLALSEPADGPITRYLKLPAPLDTVLFLLKNEDGEQVIPVSLQFEQERLGTGEVGKAAASAMGSVIARAIASSPLRLLGTVTDLVGVTGGEKAPPEPPILLAYSPADPAPPAGASAVFAQLAERLLDDEDLAVVVEHEFGEGDAERAQALGNPDPEEARSIAGRLLGQRAELLRRRDLVAAEARALLSVGRTAAADETTRQLVELDRELAGRESSLDRVLSLLDTRAGRRAPQRARAAAMEFGQARLDRVRRAFGEIGGEDVLRRVELRPVRYAPSAEHAGGKVSLALTVRPDTTGFFEWLFGWIGDLFPSDPEPVE